MTAVKKIAWIVIALIMAIIITGILNFVFQLLVSLLDPILRIDASGIYVIVLWIVTGIFCALVALALAEGLVGKKQYRFSVNVLIVLSFIMVAVSALGVYQGIGVRSPSEFSLLFTNLFIPLCFFSGVGLMAVILRQLK